MSTHFTDEQLAEIGKHFGLKPVAERLPVRDGFIHKGDLVWWRAMEGPEHVRSDSYDHWDNIRQHPECYQITRPTLKYMD
mgnify:CR=1 FL=1